MEHCLDGDKYLGFIQEFEGKREQAEKFGHGGGLLRFHIATLACGGSAMEQVTDRMCPQTA